MRARFWVCLAVLLYGVGLTSDALDAWIGATDLPALVPETSVEVRDRNGDLLRAYTVDDGRWRLAVSTDAVDTRYTQMLVAYEDKRFFRHAGVDPFAIARAGAQALWNGKIVSGGSTLTMQVARLLENSGTGAWAGKLRQIRVALALERKLSKDQILQLYLTLAPFGGNIEGVRAATLSYFGKEPRRITAAEAALLVALPQSPEARRPDLSAARAEVARQRVLERLRETGTVTPEEVETAHLEPVFQGKHPFPQFAPHLSDRAVFQAPDRPVHHLTVTRAVQEHAERLAQSAVLGRADRLSAALLLADHTTGDVLAYVGSAGYAQDSGRQGFVDMVRAVRSPGSTLKPLVYALAFDQGLAHPATLIDDRPVAFGTYAPQNFDGAFRGELPIRDALQQSLNIPVVLLTQELGPAQLAASMRASGLHPRIPGGKPGLAVALGGVGVTLEGLVGLYAGLAQSGMKQSLNWRKGSGADRGPRFVSRSAAWQVGHILAGLPPPPEAGQQRLAYKTGTSYGHRDAWAIGFDGRYVAGVWIGRADGTPVPGAFGGDLAAPVLFQLMGLVSEQAEPLPPPPPETVIVETASLPKPLRRFQGRNAAFASPADAPKLAFPPDGARLAALNGAITAKLRDGVPPFTWLADGKPVLTRGHAREVSVPVTGKGFVQLSVVDAQGRSARATVRLD